MMKNQKRKHRITENYIKTYNVRNLIHKVHLKKKLSK